MATECLTSVARLVWGHPGKPNKKTDQKTKAVILKDGQPIMQWGAGLAFPKADFGQYIWPFMDREIKTGFPQGVPQGFSYKYKDGDTVDRQGKPYSQRPGYAGCYVLQISTEAFAPPVYKMENGVYRQMAPEEYKTGDYFAAKINFVLNVATNPQYSSSIYVNPVGFIHIGYGEEIKQIADPNAMFGGAQFALPPGASATPIHAAPTHMPPGMGGAPGGMPGAPQGQPQYGQPGPGGMPGQPPGGYQQPPQGQQQPVYQQQPGPGGYQPPPGGQISTGGPQYGQPGGPAPAPAHDFVNNAGQPGMPQQPVYQQQPGAPQYGQPGMPGQMPPGGMPGGPR